MKMFTTIRTLLVVWALASACLAQSQERSLTVYAGGGLQGDGVVKAFVEPFEKETGIKVHVVREQASVPLFKLKRQSGQVDFDVAGNNPAANILLFREGLLEPIDYKSLDKTLMDQLPAEAKTPWGVQVFSYAWVLGLDAQKNPEGKPAPENWADFWNVTKFPGSRTLQNGELGIQGPFEEALLADGVPMDKLYPLDVDRAFRSLDKIKPYVRKWWKVGSEQMQLFSSGGASMGMGFDGRFIALTQSKKSMRIVWNQAKITGLYWTIPKGARNLKEAQQFIEFSMRPQQQAVLAEITGYGPSNPEAFRYIKTEAAQQMVTYPENRKRGYILNGEWYTEVGPDGKTNGERLAQRWNEWISR